MTKQKISIVFLGTTGAGPVYSYEMAKALYSSGKCKLQIIISENVKNIDTWVTEFDNRNDVDLQIVKTYKRNKLSVVFSFLNIRKINRVVKKIKDFTPDVLYSPFRVVWSPFIYPALRGKVRIVSTLHDPKPHETSGLLNKFSRWSFDRSLKYSDDIIILNNKDYEYVKEKYKKPICVIPHASFSYYASNFKMINKNDNKIKKTICFLGRIEPYKGLDLLIDAFYKTSVNGLKLIIAGSGKIPNLYREKIEANPNITLYNRYIADYEFSEILSKVDLVVLPYKTATQSGVIPLSFAYKKTVIATNVGAIEEQVPLGTGLLVEPNVESIVKAINELYSTPHKIEIMSDNAHKFAMDELTWEASASKLLEYLSTKK